MHKPVDFKGKKRRRLSECFINVTLLDCNCINKFGVNDPMEVMFGSNILGRLLENFRKLIISRETKRSAIPYI